MRSRLFIAGISGMLAVGLGAFGAHLLRDRLAEYSYSIYQTAVLYHFLHTLAWVAALLWYAHTGQRRLLVSADLFAGGILLFSGSLYLLALRDLWQLSWAGVLGPVTPIGGLLFMTGWLLIALCGRSYVSGNNNRQGL